MNEKTNLLLQLRQVMLCFILNAGHFDVSFVLFLGKERKEIKLLGCGVDDGRDGEMVSYGG